MVMSDSILEPEQSTKKEAKKSDIARKGIMLLSALLLLGLGAAGVVAVARRNPELLGIKTQPEGEKDAQKELESLIAEIGRIIELPSGESPTLATVTDLEQVKEQPFFCKS